MNESQDRFRSMLESGQDNALLRFALGSRLCREGQWSAALEHLYKAVEFDPNYSAAWKLLGRALLETEAYSAAVTVCEQGKAVAEERGDLQAAREMEVFSRRASKQLEQAKAGDGADRA